MAKESRRMPTAQGFSLPLKTNFSYAEAFENGEWHGQGIFTLACGREIKGVLVQNELRS
jgi:hypothetical protein